MKSDDFENFSVSLGLTTFHRPIRDKFKHTQNTFSPKGFATILSHVPVETRANPFYGKKSVGRRENLLKAKRRTVLS